MRTLAEMIVYFPWMVGIVICFYYGLKCAFIIFDRTIVLIIKRADAWRNRGKWQEEWRAKFSSDNYCRTYRGIRRLKPRSRLRVQIHDTAGEWVDVEYAPTGEVHFVK